MKVPIALQLGLYLVLNSIASFSVFCARIAATPTSETVKDISLAVTKGISADYPKDIVSRWPDHVTASRQGRAVKSRTKLSSLSSESSGADQEILVAFPDREKPSEAIINSRTNAAALIAIINSATSSPNLDWRRTALNAIGDTEDARLTNCSSPEGIGKVRRLSVSSEYVNPYLQRQFAAQIKTVAKFASLIQNIINSSSATASSGGEGINKVTDAAASGTGMDGSAFRQQRLYDTFVESVVESDDLISGCALVLMPAEANEKTTSVKANGTDAVVNVVVPYAFRDGATSSDQEATVRIKHFVRRTGSTTARNSDTRDHNGFTNEASINDSVEIKPNESTGFPTTGDGSAPFRNSFLDIVLSDWQQTWQERHSTNDVHSTLSQEGSWSWPWHDCVHNTWMVTYTLPLVASNRLRGVIMISFDLNIADVNQCATAGWLFSDTHLCHRETMQCIPYRDKGFSRGAYDCECRPGYFLPNGSDIRSYMSGSALETWASSTSLFNVSDDFRCLPCRAGCDDCEDETPCFVVYDIMWRSVPLGVQSFCMTIAVFLSISVFRLRKSKVMSAGMWTVLEMILIGALMLYSTVVIRYFEPMPIICLMEPWFREVGFAICYGTIVLKMYRVLVEFRTRKAHRWVVRDKDLLKYLAGIILIVIGYMSAWTAISVDHIREGDSIIDVGQTEEGLKYYVCKSRWWDYVTEIGELTFLLFGIYISYHIRNATTPYNEKRSLCLAVYVEALVSLMLYAFRHGVWLTLHPDYIFLLYFGRCQLTVSITLALIFGPKLWYHNKPPHESDGVDHSNRPTSDGVDHVPPEVMKLQDGITSNGEVDIAEINLADMDPEDIRTELRRVYTQLQILRNKTMRKDNPHISKRRGGRKATHRRFSLQGNGDNHKSGFSLAFHRHKHHLHEQEHETEISKTPEESTGSAAEAVNAPTSGTPALDAIPAGPFETHSVGGTSISIVLTRK